MPAREQSLEIDATEIMSKLDMMVTVRNGSLAARRWRRWAWLLEASGRLAGLSGITLVRHELRSITDTPAKCPDCGWEGRAGDCDPDVDGDGGLGCRCCGEVVVCEGDGDVPAERPTWD